MPEERKEMENMEGSLEEREEVVSITMEHMIPKPLVHVKGYSKEYLPSPMWLKHSCADPL